ncbi:hypothetical protein QWY28_11755 [Nocardioides sp. SOB77]|uniref:TPM domain-containing protein n=1 Tax=Nocardioides oceani TaxID=3058369 RepID=A0ABT8FG91_9ACTN|nr:hypothetical protein [Nocardioides oceani]MDN4173624.1 hypothetical protein [Nocardioides oceani]
MRAERLVCAVAALALGGGAAAWAEQRLDRSAEPTPAGDRVLEAVEGLRDDQVHVTDDGRAMLGEEDERRIAALIAERGSPVHVLVWRDSWFAGHDHYIQAAEQVLERLDGPAALVLWQGPDGSYTGTTQGWTFDRYSGDWDDDVEEEPSYLGDASRRLPEWITALPDDPITRLSSDSGAGSTASGITAGVLLGVPAVLGVWLLLGIVRVATGRRFRNRPLPAGRG